MAKNTAKEKIADFGKSGMFDALPPAAVKNVRAPEAEEESTPVSEKPEKVKPAEKTEAPKEKRAESEPKPAKAAKPAKKSPEGKKERAKKYQNGYIQYTMRIPDELLQKMDVVEVIYGTKSDYLVALIEKDFAANGKKYETLSKQLSDLKL